MECRRAVDEEITAYSQINRYWSWGVQRVKASLDSPGICLAFGIRQQECMFPPASVLTDGGEAKGMSKFIADIIARHAGSMTPPA